MVKLLPIQKLAICRDYIQKVAPLFSDLPTAGKGIVIVASGATALGVEAAIADLSLATPLLRGPSDWTRLYGEAPPPDLAIGVSFSGNSAEVIDTLGLAKAHGGPTALVSMAKLAGAADYLLCPPELGLGRRWLSLAAGLLAVGLLDKHSPADLLPAAPPPLDPGLLNFLADCHRRQLTPVFTDPGDGLTGKFLGAQWSEYLKRPSFDQSFPDWTHSLLWSLSQGDGERLAFIHRAPAQDLSDQRFTKSVAHLEKLGISQYLIKPATAQNPDLTALGRLFWTLTLYDELSAALGTDPERELSF